MYSGGIAQAVASFVVKSVHRCELKREFQAWRLQHEAADWIATTSHCVVIAYVVSHCAARSFVVNCDSVSSLQLSSSVGIL